MYKSRRRPWVKLYCREWLTSTVRFDMTECDRSRFIDLLALAGDSKVPGVVCAGYDGRGHRSGYPIDWLASTMRCSVQDLRKSLQLFKKADRVSITGPDDFPVICITAWKKYQSEYLRQIESVKRKGKLQSSSQLSSPNNGNSTQLLHTEGEVEVEVEVEGETEEKKKRERPLSGFEVFWEAYPKKLARKEARRAWVKTMAEEHLGEVLASLSNWKQTKQWQEVEFIPYPATFLNAERWKENPLAKNEKGPSLDERRKELERRAGID